MLHPSCFNRVSHITEIEHDQYPKTYAIVKTLMSSDEYNSKFREIRRSKWTLPSYENLVDKSAHFNCAIHELAHLIQLFVSKSEEEFLKRCKLFNMGFANVRPAIKMSYGKVAGFTEMETIVIENKLAQEFGERPLLNMELDPSSLGVVGLHIATGKHAPTKGKCVFKAEAKNLIKKYKNINVSEICNRMIDLLKQQPDFIAPTSVDESQ